MLVMPREQQFPVRTKYHKTYLVAALHNCLLRLPLAKETGIFCFSKKDLIPVWVSKKIIHNGASVMGCFLFSFEGKSLKHNTISVCAILFIGYSVKLHYNSPGNILSWQIFYIYPFIYTNRSITLADKKCTGQMYTVYVDHIF